MENNCRTGENVFKLYFDGGYEKLSPEEKQIFNEDLKKQLSLELGIEEYRLIIIEPNNIEGFDPSSESRDENSGIQTEILPCEEEDTNCIDVSQEKLELATNKALNFIIENSDSQAISQLNFRV